MEGVEGIVRPARLVRRCEHVGARPAETGKRLAFGSCSIFAVAQMDPAAAEKQGSSRARRGEGVGRRRVFHQSSVEPEEEQAAHAALRDGRDGCLDDVQQANEWPPATGGRDCGKVRGARGATLKRVDVCLMPSRVGQSRACQGLKEYQACRRKLAAAERPSM